MIPSQPDPPETGDDLPVTSIATAQPPAYHWYHKFFAVMLATGCLVLGIALLLYPWSKYWEENYFAMSSFLRHVWSNLYVRGAVSGIGVVNLYISLVEVFRLKRFSRR